MEENKYDNDIALYHKKKRKRRKIILLIITILLISIAVVPLGMYYIFNKEY